MLIALLGCNADKIDSGQQTNGRLSFLTYNVHGLPPEITGDDTTIRMSQIAPLLNAFDVVGLQEDFIDSNHDILKSSSLHTEHFRFSDSIEERIYGSGLSVFSNPPIIAHEGIHFETCHGTVDNASDCLASKGFQWATLNLGGQRLHLYNTHMEAGGSNEDEIARASQVTQLVSHINANTSEEAVLFLGDTNLHPDDPVDIPLIESLMSSTGLLDSCANVNCSELNHIDRLLFRSSDTLALEIEQWTNENTFYDSNGSPLSDHPALSIQVKWDSQ